MSSDFPPQIQLRIPPNTTSFKRTFEEFGFDLDSPTTGAPDGAGSSGISNGNERNKRPRSASSLSNRDASSGSSQSSSSSASSSSSSSFSSASSSSNGSSVSSSSLIQNQGTAPAPSGLSLSRPPTSASASTGLPSTSTMRPMHEIPSLSDPELQDIDMLSYLSTDTPHAQSLSSSSSSSRSPSSLANPPILSGPFVSSTSEQLRLSLERFSAFDNDLAALRRSSSRSTSPLRTRQITPPPTLPPLTLSGDQQDLTAAALPYLHLEHRMDTTLSQQPTVVDAHLTGPHSARQSGSNISVGSANLDSTTAAQARHALPDLRIHSRSQLPVQRNEASLSTGSTTSTMHSPLFPSSDDPDWTGLSRPLEFTSIRNRLDSALEPLRTASPLVLDLEEPDSPIYSAHDWRADSPSLPPLRVQLVGSGAWESVLDLERELQRERLGLPASPTDDEDDDVSDDQSHMHEDRLLPPTTTTLTTSNPPLLRMQLPHAGSWDDIPFRDAERESGSSMTIQNQNVIGGNSTTDVRPPAVVSGDESHEEDSSADAQFVESLVMMPIEPSPAPGPPRLSLPESGHVAPHRLSSSSSESLMTSRSSAEGHMSSDELFPVFRRRSAWRLLDSDDERLFRESRRRRLLAGRQSPVASTRPDPPSLFETREQRPWMWYDRGERQRPSTASTSNRALGLLARANDSTDSILSLARRYSFHAPFSADMDSDRMSTTSNTEESSSVSHMRMHDELAQRLERIRERTRLERDTLNRPTTTLLRSNTTMTNTTTTSTSSTTTVPTLANLHSRIQSLHRLQSINRLRRHQLHSSSTPSSTHFGTSTSLVTENAAEIGRRSAREELFERLARIDNERERMLLGGSLSRSSTRPTSMEASLAPRDLPRRPSATTTTTTTSSSIGAGGVGLESRSVTTPVAEGTEFHQMNRLDAMMLVDPSYDDSVATPRVEPWTSGTGGGTSRRSASPSSRDVPSVDSTSSWPSVRLPRFNTSAFSDFAITTSPTTAASPSSSQPSMDYLGVHHRRFASTDVGSRQGSEEAANQNRGFGGNGRDVQDRVLFPQDRGRSTATTHGQNHSVWGEVAERATDRNPSEPRRSSRFGLRIDTATMRRVGESGVERERELFGAGAGVSSSSFRSLLERQNQNQAGSESGSRGRMSSLSSSSMRPISPLFIDVPPLPSPDFSDVFDSMSHVPQSSDGSAAPEERERLGAARSSSSQLHNASNYHGLYRRRSPSPSSVVPVSVPVSIPARLRTQLPIASNTTSTNTTSTARTGFDHIDPNLFAPGPYRNTFQSLQQRRRDSSPASRPPVIPPLAFEINAHRDSLEGHYHHHMHHHHHVLHNHLRSHAQSFDSRPPPPQLRPDGDSNSGQQQHAEQQRSAFLRSGFGSSTLASSASHRPAVYVPTEWDHTSSSSSPTLSSSEESRAQHSQPPIPIPAWPVSEQGATLLRHTPQRAVNDLHNLLTRRVRMESSRFERVADAAMQLSDASSRFNHAIEVLRGDAPGLTRRQPGDESDGAGQNGSGGGGGVDGSRNGLEVPRDRPPMDWPSLSNLSMRPRRLRGSRRIRPIGDYMRDEDFDESYESLLSLAASIGEVKPRHTPEEVISKLETGLYREWATADSDKRCPICLDDYEAADAVMKVGECAHWLHEECLHQWLKGANTCPVCRMVVHSPRMNTRLQPRRFGLGETSLTNNVNNGNHRREASTSTTESIGSSSQSSQDNIEANINNSNNGNNNSSSSNTSSSTASAFSRVRAMSGSWPRLRFYHS